MQGTLPERNHLIVGGGIGGLAAAIAFGRNERNATVLERSSFTEESGAGIQLGPNATRILRSLGVLPAIEALAFKPEALAMFDAPSGQRLATVPLGASVETRYGAPYLTLHRADLHSALLASCEQYRSITLTPGFDVQSIDRPDREIVAGSPDGRNIAGDILVGADGLWSVVRKLVAPEAQPRFAHATAYRTMLPRETLPAQFRAPIVGLWLGPKTHLVHYPVRGGKELNVVAVVEGGDAREGWNAPAEPAQFLSRFTGWCKDSRSLLETATQWRGWSLYRLSPLRRWSQDCIVLLGDAAHPVLPYFAQGAALAIEDAVALVDCLDRHADMEQALRVYRMERKSRASRVQRRSKRLGQYYHVSGPARAIRNVILPRRGPDSLLRSLDWLYGRALGQ
jgi:2-polyprenyl-6-methoxyphenol hydroxylase-like FAD-dependent oxidoreductase